MLGGWNSANQDILAHVPFGTFDRRCYISESAAVGG